MDSAAEVCVLVHDAARFGTAERGLWHLANVGAFLPRTVWREKDAISILSATGARTAATPAPALRMAASTATRFVYARYKAVLAIDVSPSLFGTDPHATPSRVLLADVLDAMASFFRGAVRRMECGGGMGTAYDSVEFAPELHVSIVSQAAVAAVEQGQAVSAAARPRLIVHGFSVTRDNVDELIAIAKHGLSCAESDAAAEAELQLQQGTATSGAPTLSPLLDTAVQLLKLLPGDAAPLVVLVTDGAAVLPETSDYDSICMVRMISRGVYWQPLWKHLELLSARSATATSHTSRASFSPLDADNASTRHCRGRATARQLLRRPRTAWRRA